jgi:DNA modification methylase
MNKVIQGDCLIKLKELEDNSVDSIVTDPPYGLTSMTKQRTDPIAINGNDGKGNPFCRKQADKGFMGKQ